MAKGGNREGMEEEGGEKGGGGGKNNREFKSSDAGLSRHSFNRKKGHYCVMDGGKTKCLGPSKGRIYPLLQHAELAYLEDYYRADNLALVKLLKKLKRPLPIWLS